LDMHTSSGSLKKGAVSLRRGTREQQKIGDSPRRRRKDHPSVGIAVIKAKEGWLSAANAKAGVLGYRAGGGTRTTKKDSSSSGVEGTDSAEGGK